MEDEKPTPEHDWLMQLVGEWTFEAECIFGPDQPPIKASGQQITRALGSLWTIGEMRGQDPMGNPALSIFTIGFNPKNKRFTGTFVTSCMSHLWQYDGSLDAAQKVLTLNSDGPSFTGDGLSMYQDIFEFEDADCYVLSSQVQQEDGTWTRFMSSRYQRQKQ